MVVWDFREEHKDQINLITLHNCVNFFKKPFQLSLIEEIYYNYTGTYCMKSLKLRYVNSGPKLIEIQAKCLVKDFLLLWYLLNGKNSGSWNDEDFKTYVVLKIDGDVLNIDNKTFIEVLLIVDKYNYNSVVECVAKQEITRENQFGIVQALVLYLVEDNYDLYEEEFRRELLVFEKKIKDVEW